MKKVLITIGGGQFSKRQIKSLQSLIVQNYRTHIAIEPVLVLWNQVPVENIYHDYQKGQSSIIAIESEENLDQARRVEMFQTCTKDWLNITGQRLDQLVIAVLDTPVFNSLLGRNYKYLTQPGMLKYFGRLFISMLSSRVSKGYYAFYSSF